MSQLQDRIAQFRKMANDDPDNELGHYRLGQLLMEDGQHGEAIRSFRRTLELSPQFSKVYHPLAQSLLADKQRDEAVAVLRQGFRVADERGDNMPRDEMSRMLVELGEPAPAAQKAESAAGEKDVVRQTVRGRHGAVLDHRPKGSGADYVVPTAQTQEGSRHPPRPVAELSTKSALLTEAVGGRCGSGPYECGPACHTSGSGQNARTCGLFSCAVSLAWLGSPPSDLFS